MCWGKKSVLLLFCVISNLNADCVSSGHPVCCMDYSEVSELAAIEGLAGD